jgi:transcriptional regulator with XRE-family HTH domain
MTTGKRLKDERTRLKLTLDAMGEAGGVGKNAQIKYEKDERHPDTQYLAGIDAIGADVLYVLTGTRRLDMPMTAAERVLAVRALNHALQADADGSLPAVLTTAASGYSTLYDQAVAKGRQPGGVLTERSSRLLGWFDACTEAGKKMIERIAELEAARSGSKPATKARASNKTTANAVDIKGDGNVIGNNNKVSTKART